MSPAVTMLTTVFLSVLLMLGGLGGAAASDLQVYEKSIHGDKTLLSNDAGRHTARRQPHQQTKSEIHRSLDFERLNLHVSPTTSKISRPTIIRLYPPTVKPLHMHANMPMRFGRQSDPDDDRSPNSPNMPQRFGRAREVNQMCAKCPDGRGATNPVLPQRFGRSSLYWSLFNSLAREQLLNTGLYWAGDFTTSSEEVATEDKSFQG